MAAQFENLPFSPQEQILRKLHLSIFKSEELEADGWVRVDSTTYTTDDMQAKFESALLAKHKLDDGEYTDMRVGREKETDTTYYLYGKR